MLAFAILSAALLVVGVVVAVWAVQASRRLREVSEWAASGDPVRGLFG